MKDRPHNDRRWRRLQRAKLSREPICECCRVAVATCVDHVTPISKGGAMWAWDNLQSLCQSCHSKKTFHIDVRGKDHVPVKGVDARTGLPLDPQHWWQKCR